MSPSTDTEKEGAAETPARDEIHGCINNHMTSTFTPIDSSEN